MLRLSVKISKSYTVAHDKKVHDKKDTFKKKEKMPCRQLWCT